VFVLDVCCVVVVTDVGVGTAACFVSNLFVTNSAIKRNISLLKKICYYFICYYIIDYTHTHIINDYIKIQTTNKIVFNEI
jgi:hypothetical protein